MAYAKHVPAVTEVRVITPESYTLELSPEEAAVLQAVCDRIGGDPGNTRRGLMDSISRALKSVGIEYEDNKRDIDESNGRIYFLETK